MNNPFGMVIGLLVIGIGFILLIGLMPSAYNTTSTTTLLNGTESRWVNASDTWKTNMDVSHQFIGVMPWLFFIGGIVLVVNGVR